MRVTCCLTCENRYGGDGGIAEGGLIEEQDVDVTVHTFKGYNVRLFNGEFCSETCLCSD